MKEYFEGEDRDVYKKCEGCGGKVVVHWDESWDGETETVWLYSECKDCKKGYLAEDWEQLERLKGEK